MPGVLHDLFRNRDFYAKFLAIRAACPEYGLMEKYRINNVYVNDGSTVTFEYPTHGRFTYNTRAESNRFQFNYQLINVIPGLFYEKTYYNWIEVCGIDYAGFW
ncbi:hypothetical protein ACHAPU_003188 [Fusarium lateritium]